MLRPSFVGSFPRADAPLDPHLPEIAFIGRSNVGKSSLLNALVGQRIAKISGTPGKTRALNVYRVTGLYFLDLPGYGYARAGKAQRAGFRRLLHYTLRREGLRGVIWLLDIRHPPSAEDRAMQQLLSESGHRVLAALTKSDKLSRAQRLARQQALQDELDVAHDQIAVTSAKTGEGIGELREAISDLISGAVQ
ncbi:MAG: ribosome biogenesis GTP-binding protein YihA/YsxC [Gemmatimonadales bacterium]